MMLDRDKSESPKKREFRSGDWGYSSLNGRKKVPQKQRRNEDIWRHGRSNKKSVFNQEKMLKNKIYKNVNN